MNFLYATIVGFASAVISSMGMGGGGILVMYLSAFTSTKQLKAQGINLIYFLPIGALSVVFHIKNRLIDKKAAIIASAVGAAFTFLGFFTSKLIEQTMLRKAFAVFLLFIGIKEITDGIKQKKRTS